MERLATILLVAGFGFFGLAFALSGLYPWLATDRGVSEVSVEELAADVTAEFRDLRARWPVQFDAAFPAVAAAPASDAAWRAEHARALRRGRDVYVREGCWHCHSQLVRPVANEEARFEGAPRSAEQEHHALQRPVLWGTRRIGPDLSYVGGLYTNDWHAAHLDDPRATTPGSVMPRYTWLFEEGWQVFRRIDPAIAEREALDPELRQAIPGVHASESAARAELERVRADWPELLAAERERLDVGRGRSLNKDGLALVAYLQWLGTWKPAVRSAEKRP